MVMRKARPTWGAVAVAAVALGWSLGCAGLVGYGTLQAEAPVQPGVPFEVQFTPEGTGPYKVWLAFDVDWTGVDYGLVGDLSVSGDGQPDDRWTVKLSSEGTPIPGQGMRRTLYQQVYTVNGQGHAKMTIHLVDLPELVPGQKTRIQGRLQPAGGTTVNSLKVQVTD